MELQLREDFIAVSGVQAPEAKLDDVELVFVGYGIVAPEYQWDDFKGADLKGKTLVILNNDPEDDPAPLRAARTRLWYGRWDYKYEQAAQDGRGGRHHHPHHALRGLPVAGGADVVDRRAVRTARAATCPASR